ncbi:MAG: thermonuclease family protein [Candidatus Binatia bacterium]|nr:thermonuclease family protein [Candidatus Binatia bacterium]
MLRLVAALLLMLSVSKAAELRVIDGDTVALSDGAVRLMGFNAPETRRARCEAERRLGEAAKARLAEMIEAGGFVSLEILPCACAPKTIGTMLCNFGRECGVLSIDGEAVAEILIGEGLAVPFQCGATRCPKLPRPWCD